MKIVCAWCQKTMKEANESQDTETVSHGICPGCYAGLLIQADKKRKIAAYVQTRSVWP